jgi:GntR family transcriptional regulator/MocR family aminotransferase
LLAEGYVQSRIGSGTVVARTLPETLLQARPDPRATPQPAVPHLTALRRSPPPSRRHLSERGRLLARTRVIAAPHDGPPRAFRTGLPALDALPLDVWSRLAARRLRQTAFELLGYADPAGYRPLREAIAA